MKHYIFSILLGTSYALTANAAVHINEIMVRNSSAVINDELNFEGWAEIYNSGDEEVDLSNCFFSDTDDDHFKWRNQDKTVLAPKQYAVFFFDELDEYNHASFKLDCDGGVLILSDENGNELDRLNYPKSFRNTSFGRVVDGGEQLGHFLSCSMEQSNSGTVSNIQTKAPFFSQTGGFYNSGISVAITAPSPAAAIYYTTDGSEPKISAEMLYSGPVPINSTMVLRAIAVVDGEIASDVTTSSYFIDNTIPVSTKVVSLATDEEYLFGDELGALAVGVNGSMVPSYCSAKENRANYMNDWDRPCNIEIFDEGKVQRISQEVKVGAFGACSRTKGVKSIKVKANKVYGNNKFDYPIFNEKPNLKWKSFVLRNSGNDFGRMLFRDGYLQTLVASSMDIDHQAYEPAVVFVNGEYYGMMGIRERSGKDFVYSNYGLDDDEFCIEEKPDKVVECEAYQEVLDVTNNASATFEEIDKIIDVDEMLNYFTTEIYYCNEDWSAGNIKAWKRLKDGKWRWILYDTDFSTSIYGNYLTTDGFTYASKCSFFPLLKNNPDVKKRLMDKFTVHAGTTFDEQHVSAVLDSMIGLVHDEADFYMDYLKRIKRNEADSWRDECEKVRNFITARPDYLFDHVSKNLGIGYPAPIRFCSDTEGAYFELNGHETINKSDFKSYYYTGEPFSVKAVAPDGYRFKNWMVCKEKYLLPFEADWKYLYQKSDVDPNWKGVAFDDSEWKSGAAPLGSNVSYFMQTKISTRGTLNTTSYLRNTFNIDDLDQAGDLLCTAKMNDGVVIYVNGHEVYRFNIPSDVPLSDTVNAEFEMDSYATRQFSINKEFLVQGTNVVAVELHCAKKSNTIVFDMSVQDSKNALAVVDNSLQQNYSTVFNDSLTLKAVFEEDPTWSPDNLKLYLNEICVANKQYVDDYREDDDWIEIYNDGTSPVDLGGMFISDKRTNLTRYQIPTGYEEETTVPAKGYLILWADADSSSQGILHTNFQLTTKKGQTVTLSRMVNGELSVIDSIRYEVHTSGNSYSRFSYEGYGAWALTSRPTFALRNVFAPTHSATLDGLELVQETGVDVRVYPNPVDDYLWFALGSDDRATVSIIDYTGLLLKRDVVENGGSIYVGGLKPSVYIVRIQSGSRTLSAKFVKR
ncbi:MAG: CotH kinase family protein [Paludibacteraceae bacterium]|nr:CotH kinase family protein [Paludibacteraceae bacterium]